MALLIRPNTPSCFSFSLPSSLPVAVVFDAVVVVWDAATVADPLRGLLPRRCPRSE